MNEIKFLVLLFLLIGFVFLIQKNSSAQNTSCFCHNFQTDPNTICVGDKGIINKYLKLVEQGTDLLGACEVAPTYTPTPTLSPTPSPTPFINPIPHGLKGFGVSGIKIGPKMSRGFIDPYDPAIGDFQTLNINVFDTQPIDSVNLTLQTDNGSVTYPMTQVDGTTIGGHWQATWPAQDSYLYKYHVIISATSANGSSNVDIALR